MEAPLPPRSVWSSASSVGFASCFRRWGHAGFRPESLVVLRSSWEAQVTGQRPAAETRGETQSELEAPKGRVEDRGGAGVENEMCLFGLQSVPAHPQRKTTTSASTQPPVPRGPRVRRDITPQTTLGRRARSSHHQLPHSDAHTAPRQDVCTHQPQLGGIGGGPPRRTELGPSRLAVGPGPIAEAHLTTLSISLLQHGRCWEKFCRRRGSTVGPALHAGHRKEHLPFTLWCFPNGLHSGCQHEELFYYIFRYNRESSFGATVWMLKQCRLIFHNWEQIDPSEHSKRKCPGHRPASQGGWSSWLSPGEWAGAALPTTCMQESPLLLTIPASPL